MTAERYAEVRGRAPAAGSPEPLFARGGEMGALMARLDWAPTPLGRPGAWPSSLRTAAGICLESRFPMLIMWGPDLVMLYNDAFRPILGDKHPRSLGQNGADCWREIWDVVGPMLHGVRETGDAVWAEDQLMTLERTGRREDCYFTFSYSPIRDDDGGVGGVLVTVSETTERVIGEQRMACLRALADARADATSPAQAVERSVETLGRFASEVPFACIYLIDSEGEVEGCASAGLDDPPPGAAWPLERVVASRSPVPVADLDGIAAGGGQSEAAPESALALPVPGPPSAVRAVLVCGLNPRRAMGPDYRSFLDLVAEDLAAGIAAGDSREQERRRAEALAELDRAKTAFLTNVSHEFRTPLTLMLGPLEDALAEAGAEHALRERLETIHRNGRRLQRLVDSLLDFARVEAGRSAPEWAEVDVGALTAQIASSFSEVCSRAGLELALRCTSAPGVVDVHMWETIVLNLVSNAFKFTLAGSITVSVDVVESGEIVVAVADTGIGIAREDLPRLSERFYRARNARGRSVEGSGVGLALVHSLVEINDGSVAIESEPGTGTRVTIRLPARPAAGAPPSTGQAEAGSAYADNAYVAEATQWLDDDPRPYLQAPDRPLVLVVDDNADMRRHLERILRTRWNTHVVADAERALDFLRTRRADLLVTDVMMPSVDGFGLVARVRADPELAALPIIIVSARAGVDAAGEGLAAGADDYLVKPFRSQELVSRVAARLGVSARERLRGERDRLIAQRTSALAELGTALSAATSVDDVLTSLLDAPAGSLGATAAALGLVDRTHDLLRLAFAGVLPPEFRDRYHAIALDAPVPITDVVRTGRPVVIPDTFDIDERYTAVVQDAAPTARASLIAPLRGQDGSVMGALALTWAAPRSFEPDDLDGAERVAQLVARAVERIKTTEREHRIAVELQERLLDLEVRSTAVVCSAVYQPAGEVMRVGGDWYTVTTLDERGRAGVSVGDVVGHGLSGAAVMSQLRSALCAAALTTDDPAAVVEILDRYASRVPGASCATVAYAVIDPQAGQVSYTCAGHPYPLLLDAEGTAHFLEDGRRPPLAVCSFVSPASSGSSALPVGSLLLLYTDGLIERRRESLSTGFTRLAEAAAACSRLPAGAVCSTLLEALAPDGGYSDDVAMVAVRLVGATSTSFVDAIPADPAMVPDLRCRLRTWLAGHGLDPARVHDVLLAAGEAIANAIEHGSHREPARVVSLECFADDDGISVSVSDSGRWTRDSAASRRAAARGRGLTLIHGLADSVDTVRTILGTRLTMSFWTAPRQSTEGE